MFAHIRDFFWPTMPEWRRFKPNELSEDQREEAEKIKQQNWGKKPDIALSEAIRIAQEADERVKNVQSRATNILLFSAAFVPLLIFSENSSWLSQIVVIPRWLTAPFFALSVAYLLASAMWALRTIKLSSFSCVYVTDITKIWSGSSKAISSKIIKEHLLAVLYNQETVNMKVSAFSMTYEFIFRAIISFSLLIVMQFLFTAWQASNGMYIQFYEMLYGVAT